MVAAEIRSYRFNGPSIPGPMMAVASSPVVYAGLVYFLQLFQLPEHAPAEVPPESQLPYQNHLTSN